MNTDNQPNPAPALQKIYEVTDSSNDEMYWPLGLFLTLAAALAACRVNDPADLGCDEADEYDEHRTVQIRERTIGWCGAGRAVAIVEWKGTWGSDDEPVWTRSERLVKP